MADATKNPQKDRDLKTSKKADLISPEPMEVDFGPIEKTKAAAINPLTDVSRLHGELASLDKLEIQIIDVGEHDPHAPPERE